MLYQKLKPNTPGTRHKLIIKKNNLSKVTRLIKGLVFNVHRAVGRSATTGNITVWGRGSGAKKLYRNVNFSSAPFIGILMFSEFDPNRSAFVSLVFDLVTFKFFLSLASLNVSAGSLIACGRRFAELRLGYTSCLANIPAGSLVHQLQLSCDNKAKYARAAGTFCQVVQKNRAACTIRLPSGQLTQVSISSFAKVGSVSNKVHKLRVLGKAGSSRHLGFRPSVRGIAMNPVDHPHGGRSNGGQPSTTPWGKPARGQPTVKRKNSALYKSTL